MAAVTALQVCAVCKARKKKCDKLLPSCGYCIRKKVTCVYTDNDPSSQHDKRLISVLIPPEPALKEATLYRHVLQVIHETGQFVDDLSARYFHGAHSYLPVCSRSQFYNHLITLGGIPTAGFSVLLLTICLTTSASHVDQQSLRRTAKYLVALVQEAYPVSIPLIQSCLLLAIHDYTHGRPEEAFQAIAGCARMGYAAGIHLQSAVTTTETSNIWWGIMICERMFVCEVAVSDQPLVTTIPNGDVPLPTEPDALHSSESIPVSCIGSFGVKGFGRAAQAAWLLDQVLQAFRITSLHSRLAQLQGLDITIQDFMRVLMQQTPTSEKPTTYCQAIAITIRALFILHWHIPKLVLEVFDPGFQSREDWQKRSYAVLDTATKMVLDIVEAYGKSDLVAPSYSYIIRAALEYIYARPSWRDESVLRSAENRLRISLS